MSTDPLRVIALLEAALGCRGSNGRRLVRYQDALHTLEAIDSDGLVVIRRYPPQEGDRPVAVEPLDVEWT